MSRNYFRAPLLGHAWIGAPGHICECGWDDLRRSWTVGLHEAFREHCRELEATGEQMDLFA